MTDSPVVGIDLGTTNSEVAYLVDGQPHVIEEDGDRGVVPSCVGLDPQGRVLVGTEARNQHAAAPERTVRSIKRRMGTDERVRLGDQEYAPQEISAFILKALRERAERYLGQSVTRAVITVPAYFTDAQRQATREAGAIAGLEVARIVNEPTAAALAYGAQRHERSRLLVYDLGGGTFDVSVVAVEAGVVEVLSSTGDNQLGGDDFDRLLVDRLNAHLAAELGLADPEEDLALQARLQRAAEQAKIALSTEPYAHIDEDHVGTVAGRARHLSYELSRTDFETDIEALLERTMASVTSALSDAGMAPRELDRVLLVGGSTRIPRVSELLREHVGDEPHGEVDPDLCIVMGAALQAGMEMGRDVDSVLVDVTPYTFGTSAVDEVDGELRETKFVPLIRRNTRLPARRTEVFHTIHPQQETVEVEVYQGESADARQNVRIGTFMFEGLNARRGAHDEGILLTYELDLDGILELHAVERATGREIRGVVENAMGRTQPGELAAAGRRVDAVWRNRTVEGAPGEDWVKEARVVEAAVDEADGGGGEAPAATADLLRRAEGALEKASPDDRVEMVDLMEDLRGALRAGERAEAEQAAAALEDILFYVES